MYKGCIRSTIVNDLVVYVEKRKTKKDISGSAAEKQAAVSAATARCVLSFSADEDLAPNFLKRGFGWALIV